MENRNGSGYIDTTANGTQLFSTTPMDGEIWKDNAGNEYLILRVHSETRIAQVLKLWEWDWTGRDVKITVSGVKDETPGQQDKMLQEAQEELNRARERSHALSEQLDAANQSRIEMGLEVKKLRARLTKCCEKLIDLGWLED